MYSNCCCSCSFEPEIIKIGQSSYKMYSNNILNFQESTPILNTYTKKSGNLLNAPRSYCPNNYVMAVTKMVINKNVKTKRQILAQSARIFDPLSLYVPATIRSKLILRKLWLMKLN